MILRNCRCSWASVIEPNTKYEHQWEIVAHLDNKQAAVLADHGFKLKTEEDGTQSYRFKRKTQGTKKDGTGKFDKKAPNVIDASKEPFDRLIGNGSLVNVQYNVKTDTIMGNTYITGDLVGVQVLEHVAFGENSDEFEDEGSTASIQNEQESPVDDVDDDIPF